jgi:hypothetical protein
MRCILVNGAKLKADARCCYCRREIGDSYVREIDTRRVYCDHVCYCSAVGAPALTLDYRARPLASWRRTS